MEYGSDFSDEYGQSDDDISVSLEEEGELDLNGNNSQINLGNIIIR